MEDKTFELLEKMYSELLDFKKDMTDFKEDTTNRLKKIETNQEKMSKDIKTIAEVQANHMEQNEKQHKEMMKNVDEKTSLIEGAVRHLAGETTMHSAELSVLKKKLG